MVRWLVALFLMEEWLGWVYICMGVSSVVAFWRQEWIGYAREGVGVVQL